jgi:hypothetical protein
MRLHEYRYNLKEVLLEKSKLAQHASEQSHRLGWDEGRILEIETNSMYSKYKDSAHMPCLTKPVSQPSSGISPVWIPLNSNEVTNSQTRSV